MAQCKLKKGGSAPLLLVSADIYTESKLIHTYRETISANLKKK